MSAVLHINWSGGIGGAERALYQLVKAQLAFSRYQPVVAFAESGGFYYDQIRKLGIAVVDLNLGSDKQIYKVPKIRRLIRDYPLHHFHSAEISIMAASLLCHGARRLFTQRGGTIEYGPGKRLRHRIARAMFKRGFHAFSGNTAHGARSGALLFQMNPSVWQVTYNGLDFDSLEPRRSAESVLEELNITADFPVIGTAANLRAWKRIDRLIRACARLPHRDWWLIVLGDGPERKTWEKLAEDLGIADRVRFPGMREHVGDYLAVMDIFSLPSRELESFGNALVEGMAAGCPGIAFKDGGGLPEHIDHGKTGYLLDRPEELTTTLQELLANADQRRTMGRAASASVRERYTFQNSVAAYDRLYDLARVK